MSVFTCDIHADGHVISCLMLMLQKYIFFVHFRVHHQHLLTVLDEGCVLT